jgi:hypothetical protein
MSRRFLAESCAILAALPLAWACASHAERRAARLEPVLESSPARAVIPDRAERIAGKLMALSLADREDEAAEMFLTLRQTDSATLIDNSEALLHAAEGELAFEDWARREIGEGVRDPALLLQLERYLDSRPLAVAHERIRQDVRMKLGVWLNRLIGPLARFAQGAGNPLGAARAALASLMSIHRTPEATTQERQALRAYRDFVDRYPDAPGAAEVVERIAHYDAKLRRQLQGEALGTAEAALEGGRPDFTLLLVGRAERLVPDDPHATELRDEAALRVADDDARVRMSLRASPAASDPSAARIAPLLVDAASAAEPTPSPRDDDEIAFAEALGLPEDEFFDSLRELAKADPAESEMARHAAVTVIDPDQNPYAYYEAALDAEQEQIGAWLLLGKFASGPRDRGLPEPFEWLIDAVPMVYAFAMTPFRALQYSNARAQFGGSVLFAGDRYLAHFPDGAHAEEIRADLEERYDVRGQWTRALALHEAREAPDAETIASYRKRIADRSLDYAQSQPLARTRIEVFRAIASEYPETAAGKQATRLFGEEMEKSTPQQIRVSREFLDENPAVWAPGALALRPELMDGNSRNGELAPPGVTLLGRTVVRLALDEQEPVTVEVPPQQFARFVAALEEASNRQLATDERDRASHDPQRDVFFERAKLGLLDRADMRPTATSHAVFLGSTEKYGMVRRRDSILPVDVVLQGGLEDFGFAAVPKIRLPRESPDAFLYR